MKHLIPVLFVLGLLSYSLAQSGGNAGDPDVDFDTLAVGISAPCVNIMDVRADEIDFAFDPPTNSGQALVAQQHNPYEIFIDVTSNCPIDLNGTSNSRKIDVELTAGSLPGYSLDFANGGPPPTVNAAGTSPGQGTVGSKSLDLNASQSQAIELMWNINNIAMIDRKVTMSLGNNGTVQTGQAPFLPSGNGATSLSLQFTLLDKQ